MHFLEMTCHKKVYCGKMVQCVNFKIAYYLYESPLYNRGTKEFFGDFAVSVSKTGRLISDGVLFKDYLIISIL